MPDNPARRCFGDGDPLYERYHDHEWGRPVTDERGLFERLCLEGFQTGLSWITVLRKRPRFREAFLGFDPERPNLASRAGSGPPMTVDVMVTYYLCSSTGGERASEEMSGLQR